MSTSTRHVRTTRRRLRTVGDDHQPPDPPAQLTEGLPRLVTVLEEAAEQAGWGSPPAIVRVTEWPSKPISEGFELGVRPVDDGSSVVETLARFTAPREWLALGVVTEGDARHLVDRPADRHRVRCVHLVDRSGASASALRLQGHGVTMLVGQQPEGRIDDVCRRALGLATAPAPRSTVELWALVWLDRVLAARTAAPLPDRPSWVSIAELHPAIALGVDDDEWAARAADNLVRLAEVLADVHTWPVLRQSCASSEWPIDGMAPDLARWLDDGAFSRWVLGSYPTIPQLADAVTQLVPTSIARRIRAALRSWKVIDAE